MAAPSSATAPDGVLMDTLKTAETVTRYYGEVLTSSADLKTSACCAAGSPPPHIRELLRRIPSPVTEKFYGCGAPLPLGMDGLRVLDLGSGSGRDCYLAAALVGERGSVTGVDFTEPQLAVARAHAAEWATTLGYKEPNMRFVSGRIEALGEAGIADSSVDLVISNCVINLSADKRAVLREVWRVLADGGEFHFSDVYCDRRLPAAARADPLLVGECLGGALYIEDFKRLCVETGFADPRVASMAPIAVNDSAMAEVLGEARFFSITYRLFKLPGRLETLCEDYGQYAVYRGSIQGSGNAYSLDDHHRLEKNKPFLVCGNTASMLQDTWLAKHFDVHGDRSTHYGLFPCGPAPAAGAAACAPGGACC